MDVLATYGWQRMSDDEVWDEEVRLVRLADALGFDAPWAVEHHFNDYSFCPDSSAGIVFWRSVGGRRAGSGGIDAVRLPAERGGS